MATAAKLKKKGEQREDFRQMINSWLNLATASKGGFRPEVVRQYENAGLESREKREAVEAAPLAVVVSKNRKAMVPVSRGPGEVTVREVARRISPHMTVAAIEKAEALGESIDHAKTPGGLNFRQWIKG